MPNNFNEGAHHANVKLLVPRGRFAAIPTAGSIKKYEFIRRFLLHSAVGTRGILTPAFFERPAEHSCTPDYYIHYNFIYLFIIIYFTGVNYRSVTSFADFLRVNRWGEGWGRNRFR